MASPRITGTTNPVAQPIEIDFDPQRGMQIIQRFESAGDNLVATANQFALAGIAYNLIRSGNKSSLIATSSGAQGGYNEVTTDTWQILANEIQLSVWEHPTLSVLNAQDALKYARKQAEDENSKWADVLAALTGTYGLTSQQAAAVLPFYNLAARGTEYFAKGQYVLRHTTNVSNIYAINVADINVERIYTTAQLLSECQNSAAWVNPLPGRLAYKLNNIAAPAVATGYLWGWRKLPSTETTASGNRIDITTEYWLEQWSTALYAQAS